VQIFDSHLLAGGGARRRDFCLLLFAGGVFFSPLPGAWQKDDAFFVFIETKKVFK
jgi:hypothetical protein